MFVIDQSDSFKWTVKLTGIDETGAQKNHAFTAIFKRLPQSRLEELSKTDGISDKAIAAEVMAGWGDIKDGQGADVPFTTANLDRLLENAGVAAAIVVEFMTSITGAKRKN